MYLTLNDVKRLRLGKDSLARDVQLAVFHDDTNAESRLMEHVIAVTVLHTIKYMGTDLETAFDIGMDTALDVNKGYVRSVKSHVKDGHSATLAFEMFATMNAKHNVIDLLRRRQKYPVASLDAQDYSDELICQDNSIGQGTHAHDPVQCAENAELRENIKKALDELPPEHRLAVLLHLYDGYKYTEIADLTGLTLPNVRSQIYRGRQRLQASPHLAAYAPLTA